VRRIDFVSPRHLPGNTIEQTIRIWRCLNDFVRCQRWRVPAGDPPCIPHIPGLETFTSKIVHSSFIQKGRDSFFASGNAQAIGNVVIGGSMSGVEAASAAALSQ